MPTVGSLQDIRNGLASVLDAITGLRGVADEGQPINPPMAKVGFPLSIDYDAAFGGAADDWVIPFRLFISLASARAGADLLETYLAKTGEASVKAAIETDPTLGGACHDARLARMTGAGLSEVDAVMYLTADFEVVVYA